MPDTQVLEDKQKKMIEMYEQGCRMSEIAAYFGIKESSAAHRLGVYRKQGLVGKRIREYKPRPQNGSRAPRPFEPSKKPEKIKDKILKETKCHCCGKTFYRTEEWVYKRMFKGKQYWYCSYSCKRKAEKAAGVKPRRKWKDY